MNDLIRVLLITLGAVIIIPLDPMCVKWYSIAYVILGVVICGLTLIKRL